MSNEVMTEVKCGPWCKHEQKAFFPSGAWCEEPDRVEFQHAGFSCLLHRAPLGQWCGYVPVGPGHLTHGKDWDADEFAGLEVHGGITYSSACCGPICHVAAPGEPDDVWWIGFDCAHAGDFIPGCDRLGGYGTYRDVAYVRAETESLAEQLAKLEKAE